MTMTDNMIGQIGLVRMIRGRGKHIHVLCEITDETKYFKDILYYIVTPVAGEGTMTIKAESIVIDHEMKAKYGIPGGEA